MKNASRRREEICTNIFRTKRQLNEQPNRVRINLWTCSVGLTTFRFRAIIFFSWCFHSLVASAVWRLRADRIDSVLFSIKIFESLRVQTINATGEMRNSFGGSSFLCAQVFFYIFGRIHRLHNFASCKHVFFRRIFISCFVSMHIPTHHSVMWCALVPFSHKKWVRVWLSTG